MTWNLTVDGSSEVYVYQRNENHSEFVARFKYASAKRCANHFVKFLQANFTVKEYFAARAEGKSPIEILEAKGYVDYNTLRLGKA